MRGGSLRDWRHADGNPCRSRDQLRIGEGLGHASIGLTLDTYSHVLPNLQEEAIRDFDSWLSAK